MGHDTTSSCASIISRQRHQIFAKESVLSVHSDACVPGVSSHTHGIGATLSIASTESLFAAAALAAGCVQGCCWYGAICTAPPTIRVDDRILVDDKRRRMCVAACSILRSRSARALLEAIILLSTSRSLSDTRREPLKTQTKSRTIIGMTSTTTTPVALMVMLLLPGSFVTIRLHDPGFPLLGTYSSDMSSSKRMRSRLMNVVGSVRAETSSTHLAHACHLLTFRLAKSASAFTKLFAPCTTDSRGKPSSVSASIATNASRPCADTVCRSVRSNTMTSSWAFSAVSRSCAVINGATYERKQFASAYVT
mmetsp:Transcript_76891/g.230714  ORF Transcript_76891/g.230714 Transcript_76891/m.230714 type:complete len:308 (+) Transcript_76891:267-1190(+)